MFRSAVLVLAGLLFAATLSAQDPAPSGPAPLTVQDLKTLHDAGLGALELERLLDRNGVPVLDPTQIADLRVAGLPGTVLDRLDAVSRAKGGTRLQLADIRNLVRAGLPEEEILAALRTSGSTFDLTLDDVVALVREGLPGPIIKAMREAAPAARAAADGADSVTLQDVEDMSRAAWTPERIMARIRETDARFDVRVDDLIRLSRVPVDKAVLKLVWERKRQAPIDPAASTAPGTGAPLTTPEGPEAGAEVERDAADSVAYTTHREPSGGFSLNVPEGWFLSRDAKGSNSLVSFTDRQVQDGSSMADGELQVFRYRSREPDRLTDTNLAPIAENFLNRLQANFAKREMSLSWRRGPDAWLSGRAATSYDVTGAAADGTAHEGRLLVAVSGDQIFVVSYAARADLGERLRPILSTCLDSFTIEEAKALPPAAGSADEALATLAQTWRAAVTSRDFALYRELLPPGSDTPGRRTAFVALARRLGDPDVRLVLDAVTADATGGRATFKVIAPSVNETLDLAFQRGADRFLLVPDPEPGASGTSN